MQLVVFEDSHFIDCLPLVYARATFNLRCGFDNLLTRIETAMGQSADALFVRSDLSAVMRERQPRNVNGAPDSDDQLWINGGLLLRHRIEIPPGATAWRDDRLLAARIDRATASALTPDVLLDAEKLDAVLGRRPSETLPDNAFRLINHPWELIDENAAEIARQFAAATTGKHGDIRPGAHLLNDTQIHIGANTKVGPGAVLDASGGPIYLDENVTIAPTAVITGPCFIGAGSQIKPHATISHSSIGPVCKVGGEVEGTIIHAYSNKQHDGFIGHSYVGEWVNLGADTVNSDLKNTYGPVRVPINGRLVDTGMTFIGAFIGDHSKTGINVALPTGCVIGHACNIATNAAYVPRFVASFTWLTDAGPQRHNPHKALEVAHKVNARRNRNYSPAEEQLFLSIAERATMYEMDTP